MQSPETLREKRGKGTTNFSHTQINGCFFLQIECNSMFYGRRYAAYAGINAAYRRTLNGVRSTGKKNTHFCAWSAKCDCTFEVGRQSRVGALEVQQFYGRRYAAYAGMKKRKEPR